MTFSMWSVRSLSRWSIWSESVQIRWLTISSSKSARCMNEAKLRPSPTGSMIVNRTLLGGIAVMLRMLTAIPPSKVRFTIIDPVGLGRSFASFMHLADFDELIVNHRIWTDSLQIDQRLKDLTDHMENVIQTYLRNDYPTIDEYNAQAGEVAEPYRLLVVANFPN